MLPLLFILILLPMLASGYGRDITYPRRELHPLLPYVFFDAGSASIPDRYRLFSGYEQIENFSDTTIAGGTLEKYHHVLNIIAFRLRLYPHTRVSITGWCSGPNGRNDENRLLAEQRARTVYRYLVDVWRIDTTRITLLSGCEYPAPRSRRSPLEITEGRRVHIVSDDFEIIRPVVAYVPDCGTESDTLAVPCTEERCLRLVCPLIEFPFDSPETGSLNKRILKEFVYGEIGPGSRVTVIGHTDIIGLEDRNLRLSTMRAQGVVEAIRGSFGTAHRAGIEVNGVGVGEFSPLYTNDLPEGRFYNRTVVIRVERTTCRKGP